MAKIVIIRGPMASGKSTISSKLSKELTNYVLVDRAYFKDNMFKEIKKSNRELAVSLSKEVMFFIAKKLLDENYNVILTEIRSSKVKEVFGNEFSIHSFYLKCSLEECQRRDLKRQNKVIRPEVVEKMHKKHGFFDEEDVVIDTEKNSVEECLKLILNRLV